MKLVFLQTDHIANHFETRSNKDHRCVSEVMIASSHSPPVTLTSTDHGGRRPPVASHPIDTLKQPPRPVREGPNSSHHLPYFPERSTSSLMPGSSWSSSSITDMAPGGPAGHPQGRAPGSDAARRLQLAQPTAARHCRPPPAQWRHKIPGKRRQRRQRRRLAQLLPSYSKTSIDGRTAGIGRERDPGRRPSVTISWAEPNQWSACSETDPLNLQCCWSVESYI